MTKEEFTATVLKNQEERKLKEKKRKEAEIASYRSDVFKRNYRKNKR